LNIYEDGPGAGWTWRAFGVRDSKLLLAKQGRLGSIGACAWAKNRGGVAFLCPGCSAAGQAPFANAKYLWFWIRSNTKPGGAPSSTPPGSLPGLRIFLGNVSGVKGCHIWEMMSSHPTRAQSCPCVGVLISMHDPGPVRP
jgi:hypothetical protein